MGINVDSTGAPVLKIVRGGVEITDEEYAHLISAQFKESQLDGNTQSTSLSFGISSALPESDPTLNQYAENYDLMYQWLFSNPQTEYIIYMGRPGKLSYMMAGALSNMDMNFGEDGQITFTVTIDNGLLANPSTGADENNPNKWAENASAYDVITGTLSDGGKQVLPMDPQTESYLRGITYTNGKTRPMHQNSASFTNEICQDFGVYVKELPNKQVQVVTLNYNQDPSMLFVYRPNEGEEQFGYLMSFKPDLEGKNYGIGVVPGHDMDGGHDLLGESNPDENQPTQNTKSVKKYFTNPNASQLFGGTGTVFNNAGPQNPANNGLGLSLPPPVPTSGE
jgi:hypothetical protein